MKLKGCMDALGPWNSYLRLICCESKGVSSCTFRSLKSLPVAPWFLLDFSLDWSFCWDKFHLKGRHYLNLVACLYKRHLLGVFWFQSESHILSYQLDRGESRFDSESVICKAINLGTLVKFHVFFLEIFIEEVTKSLDSQMIFPVEKYGDYLLCQRTKDHTKPS